MEPGHLNQNTRHEALELREKHPDIARYAYISGAWIWIAFPEKPPAETRQILKDRGYHYCSTKREWYHQCGVRPRKFSRGSIDHLQYHGAIPIQPDDTALAM